MKQTDFLIMGQGLAGTITAFLLMEAGKSVCVVDPGIPSSSSVAGGLFNPVTGRRFVRSWMIETLLPAAENVYRRMEKELAIKVFHQLPITRFISGPEEKDIYLKAVNLENKPYIAGFQASEGGATMASCEIARGGYIDTKLLLQSFKNYLAERDCLRPESMDYKDLEIKPEGITWKDIHAGNIIFCEGYKAVENPWFSWLPFKLAKGEILTVRIPGLNATKVLISGAYLIPLGNDIYKLGSTYVWDDLTPDPTEKGLGELRTKLHNITDLPYEIIAHEAGIRPAVAHRRPFLGRHPDHENIAILNGLGTKGVVLAPYFANMLCGNLLHGEQVLKDVDVRELVPTARY
jgi:glycine/D-amino acid oxidase-like deaminating enzyme